MVRQGRRRAIVCAMALGLAVLVAERVPAAEDPWVEVRSEHFTVISNGGENKARNVAWQFEQIRGAIASFWPWAKVDLDRPIVVLAARDANTMRALVPGVWDPKNPDSIITSVFVTTDDRNFIALRADVLNDDREGENPYVAAYRSYSTAMLDATFGELVPFWLTDGLAGVLSNSIVRRNEIHFGRPLPDYQREVQSGARLRLSELIAVTPSSPVIRDPNTHYRFSAQTWAFAQYLLFGEPQAATRLPELLKLFGDNVPSEDALTRVYGKIDTLDNQYMLYLRNGLFKYGRLQVTSDVSKQKYPTTTLPPARAAAVRAAFHLGMNRTEERNALLAEATKAGPELPDVLDVQAHALDRDGQLEQAQAVYEKAVAAQSQNFFTYYRLAGLRARARLDKAGIDGVITLLSKAIELNPFYAPTLAYLSDIYGQQGRLQLAYDYADKAVRLERNEPRYWLALARVLVRGNRPDDARRIATDTLKFTRDANLRESLQKLLESLDRPAPVASTGATPARPGAANTASPAPGANPPAETSAALPPASRATAPPSPGRSASGAPGPTAQPGTAPSMRDMKEAEQRGQAAGGANTLSEPPKLRKKVDPVFPPELKAEARGTVLVDLTIGIDGHIEAAKVATPASKFDAAVLAAVRQWEYEPMLVDGKPVKVMMQVPITFGY